MRLETSTRRYMESLFRSWARAQAVNPRNRRVGWKRLVVVSSTVTLRSSARPATEGILADPMPVTSRPERL